jgi:hypothetical protein
MPSLERNRAAQPDARHVQAVANHALHASYAAHDAADDTATVRRLPLLLRALPRADRAERRAQIVAQDADELM